MPLILESIIIDNRTNSVIGNIFSSLSSIITSEKYREITTILHKFHNTSSNQSDIFLKK